MNTDRSVFNTVLNLIQTEIKLHSQYLTVIARERESVAHMQSEQLQKICKEREQLISQIEDANRLRLEFMKKYPEGETMRLSQFVARYCQQADAATLAPYIKKLKELATATHERSFEFKQVLEFSQKLVNGTLSILWSATQNVSRIYTARGKVKESYNVTKREQAILKQA